MKQIMFRKFKIEYASNSPWKRANLRVISSSIGKHTFIDLSNASNLLITEEIPEFAGMIKANFQAKNDIIGYNDSKN